MSPSTELNFYEDAKEFSEHFLKNYLVIVRSFFGDVFGVTREWLSRCVLIIIKSEKRGREEFIDNINNWTIGVTDTC